jgi:hypothetical protein
MKRASHAFLQFTGCDDAKNGRTSTIKHSTTDEDENDIETVTTGREPRARRPGKRDTQQYDKNNILPAVPIPRRSNRTDDEFKKTAREREARKVRVAAAADAAAPTASKRAAKTSLHLSLFQTEFRSQTVSPVALAQDRGSCIKELTCKLFDIRSNGFQRICHSPCRHWHQVHQ